MSIRTLNIAAVEDGPAGFGGWLYAVAVLAFAWTAGSLYDVTLLIRQAMTEDGTGSDLAVHFPAAIFAAALGGVALGLMVMRSRAFPLALSVFVLLKLTKLAFLNLAAAKLGASPEFSLLANEVSLSAMAPLSAGVIAYLAMSRRVANTFVE
jgi:ABC-type branched-subunit amino acid transport system permease subunit